VGKLHDRLAGRVSSAHDDDILRGALLRLDVGCRVVETQPLEPISVLRGQAAIVGTRRQDHGSALDALTIRKRDLAEALGKALRYRGSLVHAGDHGAELARLERCAPGEIGAGETG